MMSDTKFSGQQCKKMLEELQNLFVVAPPEIYRDTLLEIYHVYIIGEHDHLPIGFDKDATRMLTLFNFFKEMQAVLNDQGDDSEATERAAL